MTVLSGVKTPMANVYLLCHCANHLTFDAYLNPSIYLIFNIRNPRLGKISNLASSKSPTCLGFHKVKKKIISLEYGVCKLHWTLKSDHCGESHSHISKCYASKYHVRIREKHESSTLSLQLSSWQLSVDKVTLAFCKVLWKLWV